MTPEFPLTDTRSSTQYSKEEEFCLSSIVCQQRLWFIDQLGMPSIMLTTLRLTGGLTALEQTFNEIVRRHKPHQIWDGGGATSSSDRSH